MDASPFNDILRGLKTDTLRYNQAVSEIDQQITHIETALREMKLRLPITSSSFEVGARKVTLQWGRWEDGEFALLVKEDGSYSPGMWMPVHYAANPLKVTALHKVDVLLAEVKRTLTEQQVFLEQALKQLGNV